MREVTLTITINDVSDQSDDEVEARLGDAASREVCDAIEDAVLNILDTKVAGAEYLDVFVEER